MATRHTYDIPSQDGPVAVDGYKFTDLIWLHKEPDSGLWVGWHSKLHRTLAHKENGRFRKKRACLAFLAVIERLLPFDFETPEAYTEWEQENKAVYIDAMKTALEEAKQHD